jgi:UDP-sulfoquinovose synthase
MTETFRLIDLAEMISGLTGIPNSHLPNPRKEADANELYVENRGLIGLGLEPIKLNAGLLQEIRETANKFAANCDRSKIPCVSKCESHCWEGGVYGMG